LAHLHSRGGCAESEWNLTQVADQRGNRNVRIDVVFLPRSYQGIEEKIAEIYYDRTWRCLVHLAETDRQGPALQFPKGAGELSENFERQVTMLTLKQREWVMTKSMQKGNLPP
jgi:hypothetical protein